jgi:hypothetical protein
MEILLFCLGCIGMSHIIIEGKIFEPVRNRLKAWLPGYIYSLLECYQCTGFWSGLLCSWAVFSGITWWQVFFGGCAGSFLAALGALVMNYLEAQTIVNLNEERDRKING